MKNSKGFTLLEVIIVVAIFGIMAAIAIPSIMSQAPNSKLKSAARDVFSTLQQARMIAVKSSRETAVIFDVANNEYDFCDDWDSIGSVCTGSTQTIDFDSFGYGIGYGHGNATLAVPGGVFPGDDVSYSGNAVVFNPQGGSNVSGYIYLEHRDNSTTYAIGSLISGLIRIVKWNGSAWR